MTSCVRRYSQKCLAFILQAKNPKRAFITPYLKNTRVLRSKLRGGILTVIQDFTHEHHVILELEEKTKALEAKTSLLNSILKNSSNGISVSQVFRDRDGK